VLRLLRTNSALGAECHRVMSRQRRYRFRSSGSGVAICLCAEPTAAGRSSINEVSGLGAFVNGSFERRVWSAKLTFVPLGCCSYRRLQWPAVYSVLD
jgi:hypothetical protein